MKIALNKHDAIEFLEALAEAKEQEFANKLDEWNRANIMRKFFKNGKYKMEMDLIKEGIKRAKPS